MIISCSPSDIDPEFHPTLEMWIEGQPRISLTRPVPRSAPHLSNPDRRLEGKQGDQSRNAKERETASDLLCIVEQHHLVRVLKGV
jgi:hypothetical protein